MTARDVDVEWPLDDEDKWRWFLRELKLNYLDAVNDGLPPNFPMCSLTILTDPIATFVGALQESEAETSEDEEQPIVIPQAQLRERIAHLKHELNEKRDEVLQIWRIANGFRDVLIANNVPFRAIMRNAPQYLEWYPQDEEQSHDGEADGEASHSSVDAENADEEKTIYADVHGISLHTQQMLLRSQPTNESAEAEVADQQTDMEMYDLQQLDLTQPPGLLTEADWELYDQLYDVNGNAIEREDDTMDVDDSEEYV